ncbi:hypothetical protein [Streptomyces sp. NPDC008137]|uniref:hypothetical protein n=1 Tax=Streptomyces sp. NPDC008137 TaxID=3364813 RepID=UPI0036E21D8D
MTTRRHASTSSQVPRCGEPRRDLEPVNGLLDPNGPRLIAFGVTRIGSWHYGTFVTCTDAN